MNAEKVEILEGLIKKLSFHSDYVHVGINAGEWRVSFADVYLTAKELSVLQDLKYGETK